MSRTRRYAAAIALGAVLAAGYGASAQAGVPSSTVVAQEQQQNDNSGAWGLLGLLGLAGLAGLMSRNKGKGRTEPYRDTTAR